MSFRLADEVELGTLQLPARTRALPTAEHPITDFCTMPTWTGPSSWGTPQLRAASKKSAIIATASNEL